MDWREQDGARWLQAQLSSATVAFSTRVGGVSEAPFDSLNLGILTDDDRDAVAENHGRLATGLGLDPDEIAIGLQVHGTALAVHRQAPLGCGLSAFGKADEQPEEPPGLPEVDGHVITEPGSAALVFVADCLPVALSGPGGAAILHCGWRGLAAGIVAKGVAAVGATHAAIGPGVGPCCFEVGDEVRDAFSGLGDGIADGRMLDLPEVARRQLSAAGVATIETAGLCTSCESQLFFSHRRDSGRTGRQAGLVWLADEDT
jgi:YfiH family protein